MSDNKKSYYAIIPADVRYDDSLTPNAKLLYGEITALCNSDGCCWASNKYFAELYGVSNRSVTQWIGELVAKGYIKSDVIFKKGTKLVKKRFITIQPYPIEENFYTYGKNLPYPIEENFQDNNTSINNTSINNKKEIYKEKLEKPTRKRFVPPTLEEVQAYCEKRNNNVDAKKFFDYYDAADWYDSKGVKMKSWKQKVITWEGRNKDTKKGGESKDASCGYDEKNKYAKYVTGGTVL